MLGSFAKSSGVDLLLLQEANPKSVHVLAETAGLDWAISAYDAGAPMPPSTGRRRMAAIAGRGQPPTEVGFIQESPLPERTVYARVNTEFGPITFASYHAPPGVSWKIVKVHQAHALLDWVSLTEGPLIVGADANTPEIDHPDPENVRTHWHTGKQRLKGSIGDDVMFGGRPTHRLRDAYRVWLTQEPSRLAQVVSQYPQGPLAISHYTGKRKVSAGVARRFDALWMSSELTYENVRYDYDGAVAAGTDHALVTADVMHVG